MTQNKSVSSKSSSYGLKQGPTCWNKRFASFLEKLGFKTSDADPCLYIREEIGEKLLLLLYVDDGLLAATNLKELNNFLEELISEFKIVSKKAEYFLRLEIEQQQNYIKINQEEYA